MKFLSNEEIYAAARAYSENFEKTASKYSATQFFNYVAGMQTDDARQLANEFTTTALQFYLNKVEGVAAKNPLENQDLIEKFFIPFHGLKQNMYVRVSKPVDPKYKGVLDGAGADPFRVKKPVVEDIYYTFNDDYQNYITISEVQMKTAFANENGVSQLVTGIMMGLASQFTEWETDHLLETFNCLLNDAGIRDTQVEEITIADEDAITRDELKDFVATVNNTVDAMTIRATSAFNIANFPKVVSKSDLRLCIRPGLKNTIKTQLLESAFNKEELNMDIKEVVLPDFGGLVATTDGTIANKLYPVYDDEGRPTDTYTTDAAGLVPYKGDIVWYDPNADVIAVIAEKGVIFEDDQNPYSVYGIYNPRNMCTTYWANKPTVGYHYDYYKNFVVIKKKIAEPAEPSSEITIENQTTPTDKSGSITFDILNENIPEGKSVTVTVDLWDTSLPPQKYGSTVTINNAVSGTQTVAVSDLLADAPDPYDSQEVRIVVNTKIDNEVLDSDNAILTFEEATPEPPTP